MSEPKPKWPEEEKTEEQETEEALAKIKPVEEKIAKSKKTPAPKKKQEVNYSKTMPAVNRIDAIDFECPKCSAVFQVAVSTKFKTYICPKCEAQYELRPSAPIHGSNVVEA